ncbi:glycoside hydrolase [Podospora aff. communis PSN243]|uniref:Mannan endo-1,6-alpha-mannosidase n=1 Tax=Podospora aff. communis PSN243 TaxID=3040156 RepID=A0AAV9GM68_9PEZI|nr:glycoside hydrolase [Podospora aff. communis PSN243]
MKFVKSVHSVAAGSLLISAGLPKDLNINDPNSIKSVAKTVAAGAMSYYKGDATKFVDLDAPYYWWQCGAFMGSMLDYSHYTGDTSYDPVIATALLAQRGPDNDYMLPTHFGQEGNDDQAMWGFSIMAAAERNFPQPDSSAPSYLDLTANLWNSLVSRWNTTACNGGLLWQIFASNPNGLDYKNTVSNGGLFQISARLARATGNQTYSQWAEKVWDWTEAVGLIDHQYMVKDGASSSKNCTDINPLSFSYTAGIYMYGAAVMADITGDPKWTTRVERLLETTAAYYFHPFENATNIMYEAACEHVGRCNTDMRSFKGYLSRFLYSSAVLVPSIVPTVNEILGASAAAAAQACTGGPDGTTCGQKWYVGGFDGQTGLGEEMCALETIQGLLASQATPPLKGDQIKVVREFRSTPASPAAPAAKSSSAAVASRRGARRARGL